MNPIVNSEVLLVEILDNLDKNVLFLDDGRVVIKNMDYYPRRSQSSRTGRVMKISAYVTFANMSMRIKNSAISGMDWIQMVGNAWLSLLEENKQRFYQISQYCNNNTREEVETDRKEYYKEVFQDNARFIKLLPLPSLLILKISDYKTDHVFKLPDATIGYHQKVKMVEDVLKVKKRINIKVRVKKYNNSSK